MSPEKFYDAMNYLDDDLIAQTDALRQGNRVPQHRPTARQVIPWVAAAACLTLVVGIAPRLLPAMETDSMANGSNQVMENAQEAPMDNLLDEHIYSGAQVIEDQSRSEYILQGISCGDVYMEIPQTWEHEIVKEDGGGYFLHIRPPHEEGYVRVGYWPNFGVCGTGLTTEEATIAGRNACVGTYDGNPVWSFISFGDDYVAINEGADAWWGTHGKLFMKCLETLVIGGGA